MSWNITHQCRFQSRTGQQYCVNISKHTDTGQNIVQLQGSEHPFVTSEANGDDIFMPIRQQTGYLRVLDNSGGTLIDELLPENNTQKMVTLVNLTTGKTEWIGFLAAEVFTQPWGNELTELEFPLKSALACLSDVTIQTGVTGTNRLALLVYNAFASMFGNDSVPFTDIVLMDDFSNICDGLLIRSNFDVFFKESTIMNDNSETVIRVGSTYKEALEAICNIFGLTLRQQGTTLIFGRYDDGNGSSINVNVMEWSVLAAIQNSTTWPEVQPQGTIITKDLLPIADFRGSNNKFSFIPGGREAVVTLIISGDQNKIIEMPQSLIKDGGVMAARVLSKGDVVIGDYYDPNPNSDVTQQDIYLRTVESIVANFQVSERSVNIETFECRTIHKNTPTITGQWLDDFKRYIIQVHRSNYGEWTNVDANYVLDRSIFRGGSMAYNSGEIATGAIPGRWGKNAEVVENGLLLVQDVTAAYDANAAAQPCYKIESPDNIEMQNCYLNIDFDVPLTIYSVLSQLQFRAVFPQEGVYYPMGLSAYAEDSFYLLSDVSYGITCRLTLISAGTTYYWDGVAWRTSISTFPIQIKGGRVVSNYSSDLPIDNTSGIVIPVNATGKVVFEFLNIARCESVLKYKDDDNGTTGMNVNVETPIYPFHKVITNLTIGLVYPRDVTVSTRSSNVYRKTIMSMGFSEDKGKNLDLGTWNNNLPSPSLLRKYGNDGYVENIGYTASDGSIVQERPEMHLLNRMVEYYKTMRRTMEAKIATGTDLFRNRFSYNGRKYMAIDKKHDWEREEQEVKFIEVT